jgi:hypothetical protein
MLVHHSIDAFFFSFKTYMTCHVIYWQKARTKSKDIGGSDRPTGGRVCQRVNPLPLLFEALPHGQKNCVFFFQRAFNLRTKTSALERLGRHGKFKSRALWSVRDGRGLNVMWGFWWWCMTSELIGFVGFFVHACRNFGDCVKISIRVMGRMPVKSVGSHISNRFCSNNKLDALGMGDFFLQFMAYFFWIIIKKITMS